MSIWNGWFAVSVYRCLERGIPPLLAGVVPAGASGILFKWHPLRNSNSGWGKEKKKGKKKGNLYKSALLKCHAYSRPYPVWDGTGFWQKSPQFCTCDEAVCVPWLSLLASCPANSKDLRNSDNSPCTVLLWASRRVHRHLGVIKDGPQGKSIGFPAFLPVCGVQRSGWPELQVGQCIQWPFPAFPVYLPSLLLGMT